MEPSEILESVRDLARFGIETAVLQSGDDPFFDRNRLCRVIRSIRREFPRMAVTLSVGERSRADYAAFREAGADRFLLKHETVNPGLYASRHPGQSHVVRLAILRLLRELGYQVGCGCLVGLPGQTEEDLVDEILFLRDFQPDMAGNGPFVPNAHTPLAAEPPGSVSVTLRLIALSRIVTRNAHLPATTALATLDPVNGYRRGLEAGANVIMIDATPGRYSGSYRIYDGKYRSAPEAVRALIESAGRRASGERGDSLKTTRTGEPA
jgi:biotin synthase